MVVGNPSAHPAKFGDLVGIKRCMPNWVKLASFLLEMSLYNLYYTAE